MSGWVTGRPDGSTTVSSLTSAVPSRASTGSGSTPISWTINARSPLEEGEQVAVAVDHRELARAPRLLLQRGVRMGDPAGVAVLVEVVVPSDPDPEHRGRPLGRNAARAPEVDPDAVTLDDRVLGLRVHHLETEVLAVQLGALDCVARRDAAPGHLHPL